MFEVVQIKPGFSINSQRAVFVTAYSACPQKNYHIAMARSDEVNGVSNLAHNDTIDGITNGIDKVSVKTPDPAAHAGIARHLESASTVLKPLPAYTPRKLRVVTIGAGYSGLTLAHKFQHQHSDLSDIVNHTIYEARSELGGTWLVNTYPGVVCDVPSHIYVRAQHKSRGH